MTSRGLRPIDTPIAAELLAKHVDGFGVPDGSTLGALFSAHGERATFLVFLRHYG